MFAQKEKSILISMGLVRCPERFTDNIASCFLGTHLAGGTFWVLPDDYVIRSPNTKEHHLSGVEVKYIRNDRGGGSDRINQSDPLCILLIVFFRSKCNSFCIVDMFPRCVCIMRESWPLSVCGPPPPHPTSRRGPVATVRVIHGDP